MSFLKNLLNMGHHGGGNNAQQQRSKHHGGSRQNDWGNVPGNQINCLGCNSGNPAGARFCQQCGNPLQPKNCSACGAAKLAGAKFCANCGSQQ